MKAKPLQVTKSISKGTNPIFKEQEKEAKKEIKKNLKASIDAHAKLAALATLRDEMLYDLVNDAIENYVDSQIKPEEREFFGFLENKYRESK
jgi:hypothetical protein